MKRLDRMPDGTPILDDDTPTDVWFPKGYRTGAVPRDFTVQPLAVGDAPAAMPLIDPSEYDARIAEQDATESSLEHVYLRAGWENLDQNGQGYCWAYSTSQAVMLLRSAMNLPHVRLSAHAIGCKVKNFQDQGGWCGLSAQFLREKGCPSVEKWAEQSMARQYDTAETWANAALHRVTEDWVDLTQKVYDQNLSKRQVQTCLLSNTPTALDFEWWGHSVCGVRMVKVEDGSYGWLILNSWKAWGRRGLGVIRGSKTEQMGAVALRVTGASAT
jgi:hypothetical protein